MSIKHSIVAAFALALSANAIAGGLELYEDVKTKQIFTEPAEGRQKLGSFVQENNLAEMMSKEIKSTPVFAAKAKKLEFEGTHYLGYTSANPARSQSATSDNSAGFEFRRNYVQVKAYINDKDYLRVTLDATKELGSNEKRTATTTTTTATTVAGAQAAAAGTPVTATSTSTSTTSVTDARQGYANAFVKYAYLWLNDLPYIPYTGAELGVVHRPWIDYEEHNGWYYRSFNKVALEHKVTATEAGPDLINSADLGINVKTKTEYFTSELALLNGEGYHADKAAANQLNSKGLSGEWRLTVHPLGDGKKVGKYDITKEQYAHISTYGMSSKNHKDDAVAVGDTGEFDRTIFGIHGVYNHPFGLIAAQYFKATDDYTNTTAKGANDKKKFSGFSVNAEVRPMTDVTLIGRLDAHTQKTEKISAAESYDAATRQIIYGVAYKASKNVTYIASGKNIQDAKQPAIEKKVYMLTAEVKW